MQSVEVEGVVFTKVQEFLTSDGNFMYMLIATVSKYWRTAGKLFRCKEIGADITSISAMQKLKRPKVAVNTVQPTIIQGLASCILSMVVTNHNS